MAAALLFTTLLFSFDHSRVTTAQTAVGTLETAIHNGRANDEASERAIVDAEQAAAASLRSMQGGDSLWLLRPTFGADKDSTRERFLTAVRDHYLLPALANPAGIAGGSSTRSASCMPRLPTLSARSSCILTRRRGIWPTGLPS